MELLGKTPEELDKMTLSEIAVGAINAEEANGQKMTQGQIQAYLHWWKNLTPEERLFAEAE